MAVDRVWLAIMCQSCSGPARRDPQPAAYWWTTKAGNGLALCVRCCALWRDNARDDPDLAPLSIEALDPAPWYLALAPDP